MRNYSDSISIAYIGMENTLLLKGAEPPSMGVADKPISIYVLR